MTTKFFIGGAIAVSVLSACSSLEERQIASGNFEYTKQQPGKDILVPADVDRPNFSDAYKLPRLDEDAPRNFIGKKLKVVSPALVLPLVTGSHVDDGSKDAKVFFDQVDDRQPLDTTIWNSLLDYLEEQGIGIESFDKENQRLVTDWIVAKNLLNDHWYSWSTVELNTSQRFEFYLEMKPHGRTATLNAHLVDYKESQDDGKVAKKLDIDSRAKEVDILNKVIGHYEFQVRVADAKRVREIRRGMQMEIGIDQENAPAFVIDGNYDTAWPRVLLVLRKLGFDVKDYDKSNGLLFVLYSGIDKGWWDSLWSNDINALPLEKEEYRFRVEEAGEQTTLTLLDNESTPFTKDKLSGLYDVFARVMADDNLDI
jgi:outer membrane protein assembly factor BamC